MAAVTAMPMAAEAVERARTAIDTLLRHRTLRRRGGEVAARAALRGARANAALAGVDWPLDRVRGLAGRPADPASALVGSALRVSAELGPLAQVWSVAPGQALARLHTLIAGGLLPASLVGRPRQRDAAPVEPGGDQAGLVADPVRDALGPPPSPELVSARLEALTHIATTTRAPAVVLAAVAHGELLALRPFAWGDGMLARAVEHLVVMARGLDPNAISAPETGHAELGLPAYLAAARGYLAGTPAGVGRWVAHCAEAIALGARESLAICEAYARG